MATAKLELKNVSVEYYIVRTRAQLLAVDNVSLEVYPAEFISILGPSGCGKTTLLNAIDGLIPISQGQVLLNDHEVCQPGPDRAMVFQSAALLPWRTVMGNVIYGLELQGKDRKEAQERAQEFINLVGLTGFEDHFPRELSGGMQQRANLARALTTDPEILLMDEPLAALDAQTREFMQYELQRIWWETRKTAIYVTHQINEAVYLSDRVVVLTCRPGRIKEVVKIDLPRPRPLRMKRQPRFVEYEDHIWTLIEEEATKAGMVIREE
ncbi:MAG: ATP-binding cassette domain-containing protein [Anaerolineae bacterium]|nr:ATP-binding cassette domain-containing protein [Anaerolineae bacterium]